VRVPAEKSEAILNGKQGLELMKVGERVEKPKKLGSEVSGPYIKELFNRLREILTSFARSENVPPYVVFSDATLAEMAAYLPQDDKEMHRISGVGDVKFEKYGADFLRAIKQYCTQKGIPSRIDLKSSKREQKQRAKRDSEGRDTYTISLEMFRSGKSIPEIARERRVQPSTIEGHLARFVATNDLRLEELVPAHKVEPIRNAVLKFNESGALSPIKAHLGDDYSYGEIRAVIASMQSFGAFS
jgi:ATP-dependent DNA helicase RecQ